jgi:hypothetical protein
MNGKTFAGGDMTANLSANPLFDTREYKIEATDGKGNQFLHLQETTNNTKEKTAQCPDI